MDFGGINQSGSNGWWMLPYQTPKHPSQDQQYPLINHGNAGNSNAASETFVNHGRVEVQGPLYMPQNGGGLGGAQAGPVVLSGGPTNVRQYQMAAPQSENYRIVHDSEKPQACFPIFIQGIAYPGPAYYPSTYPWTTCPQVSRCCGHSYYKKKSTRKKGLFSGKSHTEVVIKRDHGHGMGCHGCCCRH